MNYTFFNVSERCGSMDEDYFNVWSTWQWWCEGVLFTGVGIIGLVANLVSIVVLSTQDMRKHTFNQLLIALAVFDLLFILVSIPVYAFRLFAIFVGNQVFSLLYIYFLYPMSPVTLCASIYMTLAITVERYLAVCKPILYRNLNATMTSTRRVALYVTPVCIVSICLNIPKFMENQAHSTDNSTEIQVSDMRINPTFMLYYTISQIFHPTLTTGILPMAALIFLNTSIFLGIRKTQRHRRIRASNNLAYGSSTTSEPRSNLSSSETNLAVILIGIVIMHVICHTLRVFLAALALHFIKDTLDCMQHKGEYVPPLWTMCAESLSSLMIMISFSGNFLIYCSVSKHFKAVLTRFCSFCRSGTSLAGGAPSLPLINRNSPPVVIPPSITKLEEGEGQRVPEIEASNSENTSSVIEAKVLKRKKRRFHSLLDTIRRKKQRNNGNMYGKSDLNNTIGD